ncbi:MAG: hypothetical protein JSU90_12440 [Nitrospiraceae bacterium]|nr:MAG: hypothetical protein JSU90_12440 [Nitrospiraceae bacterium]
MEFDPVRQCECGYHADDMVTSKSIMNVLTKTEPGEAKESSSKRPRHSKSHAPDEDEVIREIDSWRFSYSEEDESICLGTPALKSFRLLLNADTLEELLEYLYARTGREKTLRRLELNEGDLADLVHTIQRITEEKRSKISLAFDSDELRKIEALVSLKLRA